MISDSALIILMGVASAASTGIFQLLRESRNRRWDMEDRKLRAEEVKTALELAALDLKRTSANSHAETKALIRDVGASADAAYAEANQVNVKIANLHGARLLDVATTERKLDDIDRVGLDTNEQVHSIKDRDAGK